MAKISIKITKSADTDEIRKIYIEAGWVKKSEKFDRKIINSIIKNSLCFVCAYSEGKIIGMGRSISDGASDAYIQDIFVRKDFRKNGIGKMIMRKILEFLKQKKINWIGLIAVFGAERFYRKLGFHVMKKHTPMRYGAPRAPAGSPCGI